MLLNSKLFFNNLFKFNIRTFARLNNKTYDKVIPKLGKDPAREPITPEFSEIKKGPPPGENFTLPIMPSRTITDSMNLTLVRAPLSSYYTMQVKDVTYHVFNASRISLGRMSAYIAFVIQGKSHPLYKSYQVDYRDKCIIVNGKYVKLTGKKLDTKLYRHHTTYPGGLKSIQAKNYLERNCQEMVKFKLKQIIRTIKGMLPKNKLRKEYLSKVKIFEEASHNLYNLGLPQFNICESIDYNKLIEHPELYPEKYELVATNLEDESQIDEDVKKKYSININQDLYIPPNLRAAPEYKYNRQMEAYYSKYIKKHRVKWNKRIRNMGYRYI